MAKLSLFNKARKAAKKAREAAAKAERKVSTRVGTATKPGVKRTKGLGVQSKTTGKTVAQAPLRSRGRKVIAGTAAGGAAAGTTVAVRNRIKKAEAAAKKARAEAAAAAKRADAAEKKAAAAAEKGSFRKRRAARLKKRIAKPEGSEERKKIQRTRLARVMKRMADGGIAKMQGGGLSQAQQNMLRQAQEYAASSGQNPATLQRLTAQHGDLYGAGQQKKARSQMAGNQPGRSAMRGIGPGMKSGGAVKKKSGGAVKKYQGGGLSRAQQNMLRQAQELAATSGQNPAALRALTAQHGDLFGASQQKKAKRQLAGSKPGRTSMRGIGPGMKSGGAAKKKSGGTVKKMGGGSVTSVRGRGGPNVSPRVNVLGEAAAAAHQRAQAGGTHASELARQQGAGSQRTQSTSGRRGVRSLQPGMKKGGMAKQGANARLDESLGERRGKESKKSQSLKSRRNESRGARKKSRPQSAGAAKRGWGAAIR